MPRLLCLRLALWTTACCGLLTLSRFLLPSGVAVTLTAPTASAVTDLRAGLFTDGRRAEVAELAEVLDYEVADSLSLLGVVVPLDKEQRPYLKDFNLQKALRRLRLIGVAARGLLAKKRLLSVLVVPMLTWLAALPLFPRRRTWNSSPVSAFCCRRTWLLTRLLRCATRFVAGRCIQGCGDFGCAAAGGVGSHTATSVDRGGFPPFGDQEVASVAALRGGGTGDDGMVARPLRPILLSSGLLRAHSSFRIGRGCHRGPR